MTATLPQPSVTTTATTTDFTTALSVVRSRIGDVGGANGGGRVYLSDERIAQVLTTTSGTPAAVACIKLILADIARDTDFSAGVISTSRSQAFTQFSDLLTILEREQTTETSAFIGGQTYSQVNTLNARTDVKPRAFTIGMDTNW